MTALKVCPTITSQLPVPCKAAPRSAVAQKILRLNIAQYKVRNWVFGVLAPCKLNFDKI
jgi:ABC-type antimicrobial peptide transport system ATPase subunit